jgi:hypothetical protein
MVNLTAFAVNERKNQKPFWTLIGPVTTTKTEDGHEINEIPNLNLRVVNNGDKRIVYNMVRDGDQLVMRDLGRAFPLKEGKHGFAIPKFNIVAIVPDTKNGA